MARPGSYAFRQQQPGSVWDAANNGSWTEPTAVEREVALGYLPGTTAAPSLSEQEQCALLGQCIDANALPGLMAICQAWWSAQELQQQGSSRSNPGHWGGAVTAAAAQAAAEPQSQQPLQRQATGSMHATLQALHIAAAAQEVLSASGSSSDIWLVYQQRMAALAEHGRQSPAEQRRQSQRWREQERALKAQGRSTRLSLPWVLSGMDPAWYL